MKETLKKGKRTMIITISVACFCLSLIMFMQFKLVNQTDITSIENMREEELREELSNWKKKYDESSQKYEATKEKLEEYKKNKQSNEETEQLMQEELEQIKLILGTTDVEGPGIEIQLKENDNSEFGKIMAEDLLLIVNSLKLSGAEAISINGERIINMSDIVNIIPNGSESFIKVNGQRILAPYTILAIGNAKYMESSLLGNGGEVDKMKKEGRDVSINQSNKIRINKYEEEIKIKYIQ